MKKYSTHKITISRDMIATTPVATATPTVTLTEFAV